VDCESEASARADFERISKQCEWSSDSVKDQLASSQWQSLLILDNCDDMKTDYSRYISNASQVSVVLTTRLSDAKKYASVDPQDTGRKLFSRLDGLDPGPAVDLVLEASETEERSPQITEQATKIATALDFHPLALNAASSLIRSGVYSLGEYMYAIETRLAQKELLDTESEQARYRKVSTTLEVSADSLQSLASTDPTAKAALALLGILGFMHHQNISEEIFARAWEYEEKILRKYKTTGEDGKITHLTTWHVTHCQSIFSSLPPIERIRLFRKARAHLGQLSLVNIEQVKKRMSLHLLVHKWARERVARPSETWTAVASILALSVQGKRDWQQFTPQLVSHIETIFANWQSQSMSRTISDQWGLCRILCAYAWQMRYAQGTPRVDICLQLASQTQELPYSHYSATMAKLLLGNAYLANGQLPEAIDILEHLADLQGELSEADRLLAQHGIALAYRANGQNIKAIEILERVVKVGEEKLREDHTDRLASQHALAVAYDADGQNIKAIEILERVVKVREEKLREDHPDRLASQHALAVAYDADGQNINAIEILEQVVKVEEEKLQEDHPDRLASQNELANAYWKGEQTEKALKIQEHVVMVARRVFRADHPDQITMEKNLSYMSNETRKKCIRNKVLPVRTTQAS
jgi:tetratricopeptide (TPR) repeat protein